MVYQFCLPYLKSNVVAPFCQIQPIKIWIVVAQPGIFTRFPIERAEVRIPFATVLKCFFILHDDPVRSPVFINEYLAIDGDGNMSV